MKWQFICAWCGAKKKEDEEGRDCDNPVSHGICADCKKKLIDEIK